MTTQNEITASGCVIQYQGRLLTIQDGKDKFYKIPGGKPKEKENLKTCALRELKEETGLIAKITGELSAQILEKNPQTKETQKISLYHWKAELRKKPSDFSSYVHNSHLVAWLPVSDIKSGKYQVAPNIRYLIEKGAIK